jgi:hypothetical protein
MFGKLRMQSLDHGFAQHHERRCGEHVASALLQVTGE